MHIACKNVFVLFACNQITVSSATNVLNLFSSTRNFQLMTNVFNEQSAEKIFEAKFIAISRCTSIHRFQAFLALLQCFEYREDILLFHRNCIENPFTILRFAGNILIPMNQFELMMTAWQSIHKHIKIMMYWKITDCIHI